MTACAQIKMATQINGGVMSQTFIAITDSKQTVDWLQNALDGVGTVIHSNGESLAEVLSLVDVAGSSLVFVSLARNNVVKSTTFIEGLLASNPLLQVIAVGDGIDNELVLAAMRSGARDYITVGARPSEVGGLVRRLGERLPINAKAPLNQGTLLCVAASRPIIQASFIAMHLAVAIQQYSADRVLLLDLGMPFGDTLSILGMETAFTFEDALRNIRRIDQAMIESAFLRHESGVRVLSMPLEGVDVAKISSAEMFLLLGTLRGFFSHIIVNISGLPDSDLTHLIIGNANSVMFVVDQSLPSCKGGIGYAKRLKEAGVPINNPKLIIDGYISSIPPDRDSIASSFGIDDVYELPISAEARLRVMNVGKTIFDIAPKDPLAAKLKLLADSTMGNADSANNKTHGAKGFLSNLFGRA